MNTNIIALPTPQTGKISLVIAPRPVIDKLMTMLATLALRGSVLVIDGGNCFDGYALARTLRRQTPQVETILKRVLLSRVFTCYQMVALLAELPIDGTPVIILDMLATFLDENVSFTKRLHLLESSLSLLRQISLGAPVAIWARTRSAVSGTEDQQLLIPLLETAQDLWELQTPVRPEHQLPLF